MKKTPNQLEKDLIQAAYDFYARRPWKTIPWDSLFLVRLPGEDLPLVASVMGSSGEEHGLLLACGENAMSGLTGLVLDSPGASEFSQVGDLLSLSFGPWSSVPEDFRRPLERAGQTPRREKMVPVFFRSPPHENAHSMGRGDMRTLLAILQAVNAALRDGTLRPRTLDPGTPRILELAIERNGRRVSYATSEVDWPDSAIDVPALLMLPADLKNLPRLRERWLFIRSHLPHELADEDDDDRTACALLLAVENGPLHAFQIARGANLTEASEILAQAMRGESKAGNEAGLPEAILFDDYWLHGALAPALAGLDVEAVLDPDAKAIEDMMSALDGALPESPHGLEPGSLDFWKAAEFETGKLLSEEISTKKLITQRAMKRHYGDAADGERVLESFEQLSPHIALVEWLAADFRPTSRSKTLIEKLLAKPGKLDPQTRALLEARQDARISIYRIDSCEPGLLLEVEDIFDGERFTVYDRALSGCDLEGIFLPLRLIQAGEWTFPLFAGPPLKVMQITSALRAITVPGMELDCEFIKKQPEVLSYLWSWLLHQRPPVLQNTDGEQLENQNATFKIANGDRLLRQFNANPELDFDEQEGTWVWSREATHGPAGGRTVLGRLTILDDRLLLEVNSAERLARARSWLEATAELSFESGTSSAFLSDDRPLDDRLPGPPAEAPTPEMIDALQSMMLEHYKRWVDEPVPLLGGLTPRQACKTAKGKRKVQQMVRTMPPIQTLGGPIEAPRAAILTELGIGEPDK